MLVGLALFLMLAYLWVLDLLVVGPLSFSHVVPS